MSSALGEVITFSNYITFPLSRIVWFYIIISQVYRIDVGSKTELNLVSTMNNQAIWTQATFLADVNTGNILTKNDSFFSAN